jgi:hypothetical protein
LEEHGDHVVGEFTSMEVAWQACQQWRPPPETA